MMCFGLDLKRSESWSTISRLIGVRKRAWIGGYVSPVNGRLVLGRD